MVCGKKNVVVKTQVTGRPRLGLSRKLLKFLWDQVEFYMNIMDGEEKTRKPMVAVKALMLCM